MGRARWQAQGPDREPRRSRRATCNRYGGVRHLFAALDLAKDKFYSHIGARTRSSALLTLDGTDHAGHKEQGSMIRRYIIWRNSHAADKRLRQVVNQANIA